MKKRSRVSISKKTLKATTPSNVTEQFHYRKHKDSVDTSGMSIKDILNINPDALNRLNRGQMADVTSRLVSAANKRLKYLRESEYGKISPALSKFEKENHDDVFSIKGKSLNKIKETFAEVKSFLSLKTSTVRGFNKLKKQVEHKIGAEVPMSADEYKEFWKAYRIFEEKNKASISNKSPELLKEMYKYTSGSISKRNFNKRAKEIIKSGTKDIVDELEEEGLTDVFTIDSNPFS